jgi:FMN phosphatase YigB (HAD superfamily)
LKQSRAIFFDAAGTLFELREPVGGSSALTPPPTQ